MNKKFNFVDFGERQIKFAAQLITFILVMAYSSGKGQPVDVDFIGESLDRHHGYGVQEHLFDVCLKILDGSPTYVCDYDIATYNCATSFGGVYEGDFDVDEDYDCDLKIHPHSANDREDYINGVTTADLVRIQRHLGNIDPITDPYRMVSADADGDRGIDSGDAYEIQQLILGVRDDLSRTSWEWFNAYEVAHAGGFNSDPWNYTINYEYSGEIEFEDIDPQDLIDEDNHSFWLQFRTTKIGDIQDGNDWICGTDDLKDENVSNRIRTQLDKSNIPKSRLNKGTYLDLIVRNNFDLKLLGFQIPILLKENYFDIISVTVNPDFSPLWNFNSSRGDFTSLWYSLTSETINMPKNSEVFHLKLLLRKDVENLNSLINENELKPIEFIDENLENRNENISLEIENLIPSSFDIQVSNIQNREIQILSPNSEEGIINLLDLNGKLIISNKIYLIKGINHFSFPEIPDSGIFILQFNSNDRHLNLKIHLN